jgi:hypothetical protein
LLISSQPLGVIFYGLVGLLPNPRRPYSLHLGVPKPQHYFYIGAVHAGLGTALPVETAAAIWGFVWGQFVEDLVSLAAVYIRHLQQQYQVHILRFLIVKGVAYK